MGLVRSEQIFTPEHHHKGYGPMKTFLDQIEQLTATSSQTIETCTSLEALEAFRIEFLGRKGKLADLMPHLATLSLEDKRTAGPAMNELKATVERLFETKKQTLVDAALSAQEEQYKDFDVTAYNRRLLEGSLHPYTHVTQEITSFFRSLGFQVADGPEVESEFYNFEALNVPANHPARDMQDTFWLNIPSLVMRTQTSNVQIHSMETTTPPIAVISMGRVYRQEATDASHDCMFQQLEGMFIDKKVSLSHLIGTIKLFLQKFLDDKNIKLRLRPGYFPFVEPGLEFDASCPFCTTGCSVCKHSRWIEMGGSGLVHPQVLKAGGIDPERYQGFAFGLGLTRLVMLKYGISDIRLLHSCQVEFLKQF